MAEVESVVRTTLEEIEKVLSTKTVVGEPITIEGNTLIPLISIGFGFGAGAGTGKGEKQKGEGSSEIPLTLLNPCFAGSASRRNLTGRVPLYERGMISK